MYIRRMQQQTTNYSELIMSITSIECHDIQKSRMALSTLIIL